MRVHAKEQPYKPALVTRMLGSFTRAATIEAGILVAAEAMDPGMRTSVPTALPRARTKAAIALHNICQK